MDSELKVMIVGAGTGGLCLAQGLKAAGIAVVVFEKDESRTDGLYGYRVGIDADGKRALRECLSPELYQTFLATCADRPIYSNQMDHRMNVLFSAGPELLRKDELPDEANQDESVSRMTLRQLLLTGIEDVVKFNKRFTHFVQEDGKVTAHFDDGTYESGSLLVSGEGSHSKVRNQMLPNAKLVDTGLVGITGKTLLTPETKALLTKEMLNGVSLVHGPKGAICIYHVMKFKWDENRRVKNNVGFTEKKLINEWPGLLYDNSSDYIMWGYADAQQFLPSNIKNLRGSEVKQVVIESTKDWHENLKKIFALGDPGSSFPLVIRTSEPIPQWETSNVTLLGDAIHTMTPGRGVGANTALRDARLLCKNLVQVSNGALTLLGAVKDYENKMIKYGFDAVIKSRQQMDGKALIHQDNILGEFARRGMKIAFKILNHIRPLKKKVVLSEYNFRGVNRED